MLLKKTSRCLKIVINSSISFDVEEYELFSFLNKILDLKVYVDEFPDEDDGEHKIIVLNCFSNTLNLEQLLEQITSKFLIDKDYEKGIFHDNCCELSLYYEVRTSYFNDSILDIF